MPEIHKFEAMLKWAKNHIRQQSYANKVEAKVDFRACMERLSRDLKLYKISPNDLIKEKSLVLTFILKFEYCPPIFLIVCKMEADTQYLLTASADCSAQQSYQEREDPGDADVPG